MIGFQLIITVVNVYRNKMKSIYASKPKLKLKKLIYVTSSEVYKLRKAFMLLCKVVIKIA
jgi:hypothetical protein